VRLEALGGDGLSLLPEDDQKPRRCLDDMRKLSEEIKRNRQVQQQAMNERSLENAAGNDEASRCGRIASDE
jgi:hypothetical protein